MHLFAPWFLTLLIYGSLTASAAGVVVLLGLLIRDWKNGQLW